MSLINIKFASEVLGRCTDINVIIPQRSTEGQIGIENKANDEKYKCLLLLHGLSDDNTIWLRRTSIERYATEKGIAVVMPSGDRSFYTNMKYGDRYFDFISDEVLKIAREFLPISDKREDTFVAGLSMGGYGAIKTGLRKPDRFAACAGLSSVADIDEFMTELRPQLRECIFGLDDKIPEDDDLFLLATKVNSCDVKPRIYMGEGTEDFMYDANIRLKNHFESLDYDFTYRESAGTHCWAFWDEYIQYVLNWMFGE